MRIISSKLQQKNIVMSFKPYTEKNKKKKIGICSGRGSADPDPDPHKIDTDPKHCILGNGSGSRGLKRNRTLSQQFQTY